MTDATDTAIIAVYRDAGNDSELCSGYVIMPDLVLTARHCVAALVNPSNGCTDTPPATAGDNFGPEKFAILTQTTPPGPSGKSVTAVFTETPSELCGYDLALLQLTEPLAGITPIIPRVDGPPIVGESLVIVGYGASAGGTDTTSGVRRKRTDVSVESVGASDRTVDAEWVISEGSCAGDSGSPALDTNGHAIGVMSRGSKATCQHMIYQRLDSHADWLKAQARDSAIRLGLPTPAWADDGSGGTGGNGGSGGNGGDAGTGGEAGSDAGTAGSSTAGASGSATGATAGVSGVAGTSGASGASGSAGTSASNAAPVSDDGGCSTSGRGSRSGAFPILIALSMLGGLRRRRGRLILFSAG